MGRKRKRRGVSLNFKVKLSAENKPGQIQKFGDTVFETKV